MWNNLLSNISLSWFFIIALSLWGDGGKAVPPVLGGSGGVLALLGVGDGI
jgi:hypothetical protein